jgi:hypothetical protein
VGGFGVEPEVEFVAGAFGELRVGGLGVEAAAHDDDPLGEGGEFGVDAESEGDVGERAGGVDGDLVRVGVDLADEEVDGVFFDGAGVRGAFGHGRDFVGAVGLLVDDRVLYASGAGRVSGASGVRFTRVVGPPPQAPSQSTLPTSLASRRFQLGADEREDGALWLRGRRCGG